MLRKLMDSMYMHLWTLPKMHQTYKTLSVRETFQKIYGTKAWGDDVGPFCSGAGSHGLIAGQYCALVVKFILDYQVQCVVDLGCGDFAVGKRIVGATNVRYHGIDVVPELIEYHKRTVNNPRVTFQCADITSEPLPSADLCLVRQVLQHLSNDEVKKALTNMGNFSQILVSEDVPVHPRVFNRDKPHGPDVRYRSGVYVEHPPFSRMFTQMWELPLTDKSILRTVLLDQTNLMR
jgi:SAM-dependent methyltransferase